MNWRPRPQTARRRAARPDKSALDDGHERVSPSAAGVLLGTTSNGARRLAKNEKVPAVRRGRRWWFRRDQLIVVANARAARGLQA